VKAAAHGHCRCGLCGWLIRREQDWQLGAFGPEHTLCEKDPRWDGPPYNVRIVSVDW